MRVKCPLYKAMDDEHQEAQGAPCPNCGHVVKTATGSTNTRTGKMTVGRWSNVRPKPAESLRDSLTRLGPMGSIGESLTRVKK